MSLWLLCALGCSSLGLSCLGLFVLDLVNYFLSFVWEIKTIHYYFLSTVDLQCCVTSTCRAESFRYIYAPTSWNQNFWEEYQPPQVQMIPLWQQKVKRNSRASWWGWKAGLKIIIQKMKIMASSSITSWQIDGEKVETVTDSFLGPQNHCGQWLYPWNWKMLAPWKKSYDKPRQCIKSRDITLPTGLSSQDYGFSSRHVWMWELDHKEGWALNNWWVQTVVLEKTLESPLDIKEIKLVSPKGNQSWISIGSTDAEAEVPICWPLDCEEPTHWKRPWCGERLRARGEGGNRGWDGWMAPPTQWTWVWANSGR